MNDHEDDYSKYNKIDHLQRGIKKLSNEIDNDTNEEVNHDPINNADV